MPLSIEDLHALLVLNHASGGIGFTLMEELRAVPPAVLIARILDENLFGKAEAVENCLKEFHPQRELEACEMLGARVLTFWDEDYPASLRDIPHPPPLLYVLGRILREDSAAIAVVGSRYPSLYGISQTRKFTARLAQSGLTVVSGLAQGIDLAAHEGALTVSYGRTIAVLGCGLGFDYPKHRKKFQEKIRERGAVVSEYSLTMPPLPENFPKRNRVIAGLSLGVLVMEANQKSGSLITAQLAMDQGREVFAMPGPVDGMTSKGTNQLIKEGAYLAESAEDIIEVLRPMLERLVLKPETPAENLQIEQKPRTLKQIPGPDLSPEGREIVQVLKSHGPMAWPDFLEAISCNTGNILALMTELELKKVVRKRLDGRFEALL